jgi:AcrR family transcriptional regulator
MKTETEGKRLAILEAAAEARRDLGLERASMSEIRARVGDSKATPNYYFPATNRLIAEVMYQGIEAEIGVIVGSLNSDAGGIKSELMDFGSEFLHLLYSLDYGF